MTRALLLDYQRSARPGVRRGVLLLAAGIASAGALSAYYLEVIDKAGKLEARAHGAQRAAQERTAAAREGAGAPGLAREISRANEVLGQLAWPWDSLFKAVELSAGKDVALLAMEPDVSKGLLKIGGEAKSIEAMLGYVARLQAREEFGGVDLQSHQVQQQDRERPVRFVLAATWKVAP